MGNLIKKLIHCPQCDNIATQERNWLGETSTLCPYCGYSEIKTADKEKRIKGYGALIFNGQLTQFHEPISYEQENEIIDIIKNKQDASFYKWSDTLKEVIVVKGELISLTEEEENQIQSQIDESEYYNSIRSSYPVDEDCVEFSSISPTGEIIGY